MSKIRYQVHEYLPTRMNKLADDATRIRLFWLLFGGFKEVITVTVATGSCLVGLIMCVWLILTIMESGH